MNHLRSALLGLVSVLVLAGCATAPSASEKAAVAFDYSKLDKPPQTRFMARPEYPPELRLAGVEGYAIVDFIVGTDGAVKGAFVAKASDERFGPAALEAVQKWKFTPGELKGAVVECHMQVPIRF